MYSATERIGVVTVCAVVSNILSGSPRPFTLNFTTEDGSAGTLRSIALRLNEHFHYCFSLRK